MKKIIIQAVLLVIVSLGIGLIYNSFHKPHLPLFALNGEEIMTADSVTVNGNGNGHDFNEPMAISLEQARQLFEQGEVLFIDARTEGEFRTGHIAGAICISIEEESDPEALLASLSAENYITYCDGETCLLSTDLAYLMVEIGMSPVYVFHSGLEAWQASGLPLERNHDS